MKVLEITFIPDNHYTINIPIIDNKEYANIGAKKNQPGRNRYIIADRKTPIGVFIISSLDIPDSHTHCYIELIYLKKEYRGKGIGTAVLQEIIDRFMKIDPTMIIQSSCDNEVSKKLHRKIGFHELDISKIPFGLLAMLQILYPKLTQMFYYRNKDITHFYRCINKLDQLMEKNMK